MKKLILSNVLLSLCFICAIIYLVLMNIYNPKNIYKNALNYVVEVKASNNDLLESFGSGVIYDDGLAITNAHVVSYQNLGENYNFDFISIRSAKSQEYIDASIIKIDYDLDLAILSFDAKKDYFKPISLTDVDYESGDKVYAIGNTSNCGIGISEGIISVKEVNILYQNNTRNVIQADISISNGNSGGALLNEKGKLIGIATFRTKDDTGKIIYGYLYSIPLKTILEFI